MDDECEERPSESGACNDDTNNDDSTINNNNGISNDSEDQEKTNLIVNYLPQQMTDDEFENLFKKFGTMKSCKIVRNRVSGYSYGFGFVDFTTHEQAIKAIEELNGHELDNKKIKVAFARPAGQDIKQANLYIKNVPHHWTQEDVKKEFDPYGNIIQVRVLGNNRGVAFVLFDLRKQAEEALEALNGKTVEGSVAPLEIKFAADKKTEKGAGGGGGGGTGASSGAGAGGGAGSGGGGSNNRGSNNSGTGHKRERGNRGGRNRNRRPGNQRSFFDRQNNYNDRQQNMRGHGGGNNAGSGGGADGSSGGGGGQSQYNAMSYGPNTQYSANFSMNGVGPIRQMPTNRMTRYAPFIPVQQPMTPAAAAAPINPQMAPNPAYGFPAQQQMIPFAMLPAQQMAAMQSVNQTGQLVQNPMSMYGAQMSMGYAPVTPSALSNIYSVASNNLTNAANMQPQIGQPMTMRSSNSGTNDGHDDGVTLFVYNIGPDADENELRSMFSSYGQVTKSNVVRKTPGGETKGFGFVTMRDRDQANSAIAGLNGSMRYGRALQVSLKK